MANEYDGHSNPTYDGSLGKEPKVQPIDTWESNKSLQTRNLWLLAVVIGVAVSLGAGIGIGVAIGKNNVESINEPIAGSQEPTSPQATEEPGAEHWIDLPCMQDTICPAGVSKPPMILISLDGFRADFMDRGLTPNLDKLQSCGVQTPHMTPTFPTLTFPNHYTQVTGLFPESHGIVGNNMYDPVLKKSFSLSSSEKMNPAWWGGEPIWNTAKKHNLRTASYFWVGSDVDIQDMRPDYWFLYAGDAEYLSRVDVLVALLDQPSELRPDFLTLYFDEPDHAGHDPGPNTQEEDETIAHMDNVIGYLMDGLMRIGLHDCMNVIVMADHGMANRTCEQLYVMNEYLDADDYYTRNTGGTMLRLDPKYDAVISDPREVVQTLQCTHEVAIPYVKTDIPKRWHYINNIRIEDILVTVPAGWTASPIASDWCDGGTHGYDNLDKLMRALFVAHGPAFKSEITVEPFQNIELYEMMCEILGITPAPNNGTRGALHHLLKNPNPLPSPPPMNISTSVSCDYPTTDSAYQSRLVDDATGCSCGAFSDEQIKIDFDSRLISDPVSLNEHAPFGLPIVQFNDDVCELYHQRYINVYSHSIGAPLYATFTINKDQITNLGESITNCSTRPDVRLAADTLAYSCIDTGNMTGELANLTTGYLYPPLLAGDSTEEAMDALITSNAVPQFSGFKRDMWDGFLFQHVGRWADDANGINVVTGPVYEYDGDGFQDHRTVRENNRIENSTLLIPSHYFMVLSRCAGDALIDSSCSNIETAAFMLPNMDGIYSCQTSADYVEHHRISIGDVEKLTGLSLFPSANLDDYQHISIRSKIYDRGDLWKDWPYM